MSLHYRDWRAGGETCFGGQNFAVMDLELLAELLVDPALYLQIIYTIILIIINQQALREWQLLYNIHEIVLRIWYSVVVLAIQGMVPLI